jgi:hypothetical protein
MHDTTFAPEYRIWQREEWLPTATAGYLMCAPGAATTLVMTLQKLGAVTRLRHGDIRHACQDCLSAAGPEAMDLIAGGAICEAPFCARKPESGCGCCGGAFCRNCLIDGGYAVDTVACDHGSWPVICSQPAGRPWEADIAYTTEERYPPGGLCVLCACERIHAVKAAATRVFERDYAGRLSLLSGPDGVALFAVPAPARLTSGGRLRATRKSRQVAQAWAAEIGALADRSVAGLACGRSKEPATGGGYAPHTGYVLVRPGGQPAGGAASPADREGPACP